MKGVANSVLYEAQGTGSPVSKDRRQGERHKTILRVAKLVSGKNRGLAIIRNVSDSGMLIEVNPSMKFDEDVTVMLTDQHAIEGEIRWRKESQLGIRFKDETSVEEILARPERGDKGHVARLPRFELEYPITLVASGKVIEGRIADISLGGIRVQASTTLNQGDDVTALIPELKNLPGTVRWCTEDHVGISFYRPVHIQDFMAWLAGCEDRATLVADGVSEPQASEPSLDGAEPPFVVSAFDEAGHRHEIATVGTASEAWAHFNESRSLFYRVTVVDRSGVEAFPVRLKALASREIAANQINGHAPKRDTRTAA